jgi:hypothetical protein
MNLVHQRFPTYERLMKDLAELDAKSKLLIDWIREVSLGEELKALGGALSYLLTQALTHSPTPLPYRRARTETRRRARTETRKARVAAAVSRLTPPHVICCTKTSMQKTDWWGDSRVRGLN